MSAAPRTGFAVVTKHHAIRAPRPTHTSTTLRPLTAREESLAVDVASGMPVAEAFMKHYKWRGKVESIGREAGKVERRTKVAARITELRNEYARAAIEASRGKPPANSARSYTVADSMAELDQARDMAIATNSVNTLVRIVEVRMKLYGLGIAEARNPAEPEEMSPEQLHEALETLRAVKKRLAESQY